MKSLILWSLRKMGQEKMVSVLLEALQYLASTTDTKVDDKIVEKLKGVETEINMILKKVS